MTSIHPPRTFSFASKFLFASVSLMTLFGCGSKVSESTNTVLIQGHILLDAAPLAGARVTFIPIAPLDSPLANITPMSYGITDAEGQYRLQQADGTDGVAKGLHTVLISKPINQHHDRDDNQLSPKPTDAVPEFYRQHGYIKRHVMPMKETQQMDFMLSTIDPLLKE